jgi:transposase-like protein
MSNRYTADHKTAAMVLLERNRGNIRMTAQQAGVPERTLREWRNEQQAAPCLIAAAVQKAKMPQRR